MKRVSVIGLDSCKDQLLADLMDIGIVQITDQKTDEEQSMLLVSEGGADSDKVASLDQQIGDVELALETLKAHSPEKSPLFATRRPVRKQEFEMTLRREDEIRAMVKNLIRLRDAKHREQEAKNRDEANLAAIAPWGAYGVPLEVTSTDQVDIQPGLLPVVADTEPMLEKFNDISDRYVFEEVNRDKDFVYYILATMKDVTDEIQAAAKQHGFSPVQFKELEGTVPEASAALLEDIAEREKALESLSAEITGHYSEKDDIECLHDELLIERDEERIKDKLKNTKRTFRFEGWMPAGAETAVTTALEKYECWYEYRDPEEDEEVPVLLHNTAYATPYETIVDMYSLPDYRGYDPTGWVSVFYCIFFGMMLSDAGYGLLLMLVTGLILKKFRLEGNTYNLMRTFFYGGVSTVFWGILFGGWFGNIVEVFSSTFLGKTVTIPPVWFNPIDDPTKLLVFSLGLGVIHLFVGMGINAKMLIKEGKWFDAICDDFSWYLVIVGGIMLGVKAMAGGSATVGTIGKYLLIAGFLILLLTGGRAKKGVFGKILGGLGSVYNVTSYLSDILSYARLLALGMATGVIAQVMNTIGTMPGKSVVGFIVLVVVFVFGHALNLVINLLGAFVHSSRLQYLEFFGKFYIDGGEAFDPFRKNTKYVRLTENTLQGGNRK